MNIWGAMLISGGGGGGQITPLPSLNPPSRRLIHTVKLMMTIKLHA